MKNKVFSYIIMMCLGIVGSIASCEVTRFRLKDPLLEGFISQKKRMCLVLSSYTNESIQVSSILTREKKRQLAAFLDKEIREIYNVETILVSFDLREKDDTNECYQGSKNNVCDHPPYPIKDCQDVCADSENIIYAQVSYCWELHCGNIEKLKSKEKEFLCWVAIPDQDFYTKLNNEHAQQIINCVEDMKPCMLTIIANGAEKRIVINKFDEQIKKLMKKKTNPIASFWPAFVLGGVIVSLLGGFVLIGVYHYYFKKA